MAKQKFTIYLDDKVVNALNKCISGNSLTTIKSVIAIENLLIEKGLIIRLDDGTIEES